MNINFKSDFVIFYVAFIWISNFLPKKRKGEEERIEPRTSKPEAIIFWALPFLKGHVSI